MPSLKSGLESDSSPPSKNPLKRSADGDPEPESNSDSESNLDPETESHMETGSGSNWEHEVSDDDAVTGKPLRKGPRNSWFEDPYAHIEPLDDCIFETDPTDGIHEDVLCEELKEEIPDDTPIVRLTEEEFEEVEREYEKHANETEGFDVPRFPGLQGFGLIRPAVTDCGMREYVVKFAKAAVNYENRKREENDKLKLLRILKVMQRGCSPLHYYFTLEAQHVSSGEIKVYEALVYWAIPMNKSQFPIFRVKGDCRSASGIA